MGCISPRSRPTGTGCLQRCQRAGELHKQSPNPINHTNSHRTSSTPPSMPTMLQATTMTPAQPQIVPQTPSPAPGQARALRVRLGKVSSRSRCVMSVVQLTPITRTRSTPCSLMAMTVVLFGVGLFAVAILRRLVTLSMLLIWVASRALSTSVTRIPGTRLLVLYLNG